MIYPYRSYLVSARIIVFLICFFDLLFHLPLDTSELGTDRAWDRTPLSTWSGLNVRDNAFEIRSRNITAKRYLFLQNNSPLSLLTTSKKFFFIGNAEVIRFLIISITAANSLTHAASLQAKEPGRWTSIRWGRGHCEWCWQR